MIPIRVYRQYWLDMKPRVPAISQVVFARTESELAMKIKEIADKANILIAIIPSSDTMAPDHDNIREHEIGLIYAMQKVNRNDMDDEDLLNVQEATQNIIKSIKTILTLDAATEGGYHQLCRDMNLSKLHTDPEYNYLGCDGYSLTIEFNTPGF